MHDAHGIVLPELDPGGGHGVAYRPNEPALDLTAPPRELRPPPAGRRAAAGVPAPRLIVDPGRAGAGLAPGAGRPGPLRT
ncbi:hypothetical protein [Streptomyces sp. NPDC001389]|uniref:hypothetical protein n=1 Tax=unclassified Streptomyces TaxID=2593676 RepID=UPI0036B311A1